MIGNFFSFFLYSSFERRRDAADNIHATDKRELLDDATTGRQNAIEARLLVWLHFTYNEFNNDVLNDNYTKFIECLKILEN